MIKNFKAVEKEDSRDTREVEKRKGKTESGRFRRC